MGIGGGSEGVADHGRGGIDGGAHRQVDQPGAGRAVDGGVGKGAVSYTHLDVYKRQVLAIRGEVDLAALGRPIEAMVALRFTGHARESMDSFRDRVASIPGVVAAYHVAGADDFLVHISGATANDLRDLVLDHLTSVEGVAHAQTSLIFERVRGRRPLG